ncbi:MAG: flagellar basal-body rod protein FlgG [Planctomycetaceae bacterium]|nr:flagellar basal-body rod protein FlgG [Planctomycetaceae bacterium]
MGLRAMHSASTGMSASLTQLDVIANNLANASTTAFKRSRVNFEDLYYEHMRLPGAQDSQGKLSPTGISVGLGTRVAATAADHREGSLLETGNQLDLAITGDGFFKVQDGTSILYTRSGAFSVNADGDMVMQSADRGRLIEPAISIPQDATEISISSDGIVSVLQPGSSSLTQVGQIQTVRFVNPQGLLQQGENLYAATDASGTPLEGNPGLEGRGLVRQGFLEQSNVEPVRELVDLIKSQRHFEMNSQVIQAADQLLQLVANLRRF